MFNYSSKKTGFFKGGGVTLCQTLSSWRFRHGILYGCLLKKAYKGGVTGTPRPHLVTPLVKWQVLYDTIIIVFFRLLLIEKKRLIYKGVDVLDLRV